MFKKTLTWLVFTGLLATPTFAQDIETYTLQEALNARGYDVEPDSVDGPATRRALAEFAEANNLPSSERNEIIGKLVSQTIGRSTRLEPSELDDLLPQIAQSLKDPTSVIFNDEEIYVVGNYICGEVNGKNSYGAYAGSTKFAALSSIKFSEPGSKVLAVQFDPTFVLMVCLYGVQLDWPE